MEILYEFSSEDDDEPIELPLQKFKNWYNGNSDETPFQRQFRKKHSTLDIPGDFPNRVVVDAYYNPLVHKSPQQFEWGQPQLDELRRFLTEAFSWSEVKVDQVLLPVLRQMNTKKRTRDQQEIDSVVESWRIQKKLKFNYCIYSP